MSNLIDKFEKLMSHLNAEDNEMANEFLKELEKELMNDNCDNGFIQWNRETKNPPVGDDVMVEYYTRDGYVDIRPAGVLSWGELKNYSDCEIMKYRVIK